MSSYVSRKKIIISLIFTLILSIILYILLSHNIFNYKISNNASSSIIEEYNYGKIKFQEGLNIMAFDLGGPLNLDRANSAFGDATLIEQNNNYLLIDTGTDDNNDVLINYLKAHNINRLSIYLSHYHNDHYGKIKDIIADNYFTVDNVYIPNPQILESKLDESKEWNEIIKPYFTWGEKYIKSLINLGANVVIIEKGSKINIGEAILEVIWDLKDSTVNPDEMYNEKTSTFKNRFINDSSIVSMITYRGVKFLTAGDIEKSAEEDILNKNIDIKADIFKFSHHGGSGSNTEAFVNKVNPKYAYFPNNYTAGNNVVLWYGDRDGGKFKPLVDMLESKTNVLSTLYNGNILYNISPNGTIKTYITRNYNKLTIKYIDKKTNEEIIEPIELLFNNRSIYHLEKLDYLKNINGYKFINNNYVSNDILDSDKTIINYYEKIEMEDTPNETKQEKPNNKINEENNNTEQIIIEEELNNNKEKEEKIDLEDNNLESNEVIDDEVENNITNQNNQLEKEKNNTSETDNNENIQNVIVIVTIITILILITIFIIKK